MSNCDAFCHHQHVSRRPLHLQTRLLSLLSMLCLLYALCPLVLTHVWCSVVLLRSCRVRLLLPLDSLALLRLLSPAGTISMLLLLRLLLRLLLNRHTSQSQCLKLRHTALRLLSRTEHLTCTDVLPSRVTVIRFTDFWHPIRAPAWQPPYRDRNHPFQTRELRCSNCCECALPYTL